MTLSCGSETTNKTLQEWAESEGDDDGDDDSAADGGDGDGDGDGDDDDDDDDAGTGASALDAKKSKSHFRTALLQAIKDSEAHDGENSSEESDSEQQQLQPLFSMMEAMENNSEALSTEADLARHTAAESSLEASRDEDAHAPELIEHQQRETLESERDQSESLAVGRALACGSALSSPEIVTLAREAEAEPSMQCHCNNHYSYSSLYTAVRIRCAG